MNSLPDAPPRNSAATSAVGSDTGPRWPEPTAVVSSKFSACAMPPFSIAATAAGSLYGRPMSDASSTPPALRAQASSSGMPMPSVLAAMEVASVSNVIERTVRRTLSGRSSYVSSAPNRAQSEVSSSTPASRVVIPRSFLICQRCAL